MNKKAYNTPKTNIVSLHTESALLSVSVSEQLPTGGQDDVIFESNGKGWNSDSWSDTEE